MSERLAQILESERLVSREILDEAQRRRVLYEGSLDTNLLELGVIGESDLSRALGEAYRLPVGEKSDIDTVEAHIPRIFPLQFAEAYRMVPFRLIGPNLSVLVNSEPDPQLFARIRERLQLHVNATVTTEARLHYAMHRLYATKLLPRFASLLSRLDGEPPRPLHEPPAGEHFLSWGLPSSSLDGAVRRKGVSRSGSDIAALLARLDTAPNRDAVVEILLEIAVGVFDYVCMFVVQGDHINGWRGVDPEHTARIAQISIPVANPSVFQTIYATQGHYLGPLPKNRFNEDLLRQLGREPPRTALLAPILVRGKLVAVVYADNGPRSVPSRRVSGLLLLAHRVGMCLENLIRRHKRMQAAGAGPQARATESPAVQAPAATVRPPRMEDEPEAPPLEEPELLAEGDFEIIEEDPDVIGDGSPEEDSWSDVDVGWEEALPAAAEAAGEADDGYVAFSDVGDSPEESLADWEDVLVDAASSSMESSAPHPAPRAYHAKPAVDWNDVIAEAMAAPSLINGRSEQPIEVAGTQVDPIDLLFDSLGALDASTRSGAVDRLLLLGSNIDNVIQSRFPGPLTLDPFAEGASLASFQNLGGLCELLQRRGQSVAGLVLPFLESQDRNQRFVATYFFLAVQYPTALDSVARRLYDVEPRIRYLAADALRGYTGEAAYTRILQSLREQLKVPVLETQVTTVQVLGQLRDPRAVPSLIPLVVSPQPPLRAAATSALAVICAQAFDQDVSQWAEWWRASYVKPREAWLVASLRHDNPHLQRIAFNELQLMTGYTGSFDPSGSPAEKEPVIRVWEAWLQELERSRTDNADAQPSA